MNNTNDISSLASDKAIHDMLEMWIRPLKNKAAEQITIEHLSRQQSRFKEPQIQSRGTLRAYGDRCTSLENRRSEAGVSKKKRQRRIQSP
jgi:low affinity Fe/Cu permease